MKFLAIFNREEKQFFYLLLLLFLVFYILRLVSGNYYLFDSYEYLEVAESLRDFSLFQDEQKFADATKRPFVYPLFLALLKGLPAYLIVLVQTFFGVITMYYMLRIIKKLGGHLKRWHLLLFLFTPSIFIYTQMIMADWIAMLMITILFWLLINKWNGRNFAYIQLITLALAFVKPVFYPLIYWNLLCFGIYFIRKRSFNLWLIIPVLVLQGYMEYNGYKTGYKHFSSIENSNLINYNLYFFKSSKESMEAANKWRYTIYTTDFYELDFKEKNELLRDAAYKEIKANFFSYSFYHFYTSVRGVFDPGRFDLVSFFGKEDGQQGLLEILNSDKPFSNLFEKSYGIAYLLLIPIVIVILVKWLYSLRFIFSRRLDLRLYYLLSVMVICILLTGPVNSSRYMMPFQGILIVFTILGLSSKRKVSVPS